MIDPKELRIGNFLNAEKHNAYDIGGIVEVKIILNYGINQGKMGEYGYPYKLLSGIPLTEEIFNQCGFEWIDVNEKYSSWLASPETETGLRIGFHKGDTDKISILQRKLPFDSGNKNYLHLSSYHFQFLHQLQNLYFALSGKELHFSQQP